MCEYQFQVEVQVMHLCSTPINGVKSNDQSRSDTLGPVYKLASKY